MNIYGMLVGSVFLNKLFKEKDHVVYKYIFSCVFLFQTSRIIILGSKAGSIK